MDSEAIKRPLIITILCIVGFILLIQSIGSVIIGFLYGLSVGYKPFLQVQLILYALLVIVGVVGLIGYWKMRKWGVYLYTATIVIIFVYAFWVFISLRGFQNFNLDYVWIYIWGHFIKYFIALFIIVVGFIYLKKMR